MLRGAYCCGICCGICCCSGACCCCKGAWCGCYEELIVVVGEETVAQVDVEGLVVIWELVVELELAVDC